MHTMYCSRKLDDDCQRYRLMFFSEVSFGPTEVSFGPTDLRRQTNQTFKLLIFSILHVGLYEYRVTVQIQ